MKTNFRRLVSFVLAMTMVLSLGTLNVFAITEEDDATVTIQATNLTLTKSEADQTVNVVLYMDQDAKVSNLDAQVSITDNENMGITFAGNATVHIPNVAGTINFPAGGVTGGISAGDQNADHYMTKDNSLNGYVLATIPVTIPANAVGNATINFSGLNIADYDNASGYNLASTNAVATITVNAPVQEQPDDTTTEGYTVSTSADTTTVNNDGTASNVTVNVVVNKTFNSAELKLSYDKDCLNFVSGVPAQTMPDGDPVAITGADGVITIRDYGAGYAVGNAYTLTFTSTKGGVAHVAVTSAGFSTHKKAETEDLIPATTSGTASVTINHQVTIKNSDTNTTTHAYVTPGQNYEFQIPDYSVHYNYTVDVSGGNKGDSGNGSYTISGVTDATTITYSKTPVNYTVRIDDKTGVENGVVSHITGATLTNGVYTVPYNTAVSFNVAAGKAPQGINNGYRYNVKVYLTGNSNQTLVATPSDTNAYTAKTYTIAAGVITGDITIEVTKEVVSASETTINIPEHYTELSKDGSALTSGTLQVNKNSAVTLTLSKEEGYDYTVQTKDAEGNLTDVTVGDDGSFTINVGDASVTLIITKTAKVTLNVDRYVQLDGTVMWLVKVNSTKFNDKVYTYTDGGVTSDLFWSNEYEAYCYLVVEATNPYEGDNKEAFVAKFKLRNLEENETVTSISYNGNVNLTKNGENAVIDVNDAQLVWNMYSAVYSNINTNVTVQKFLEADMDHSGTLSTSDAALVVAAIPAN